MTETEMSKLLATMTIAYPSYKPQNPQATVKLWTMMFEDVDYNTADTALKSYILSNTSAFAPSISQLREQVQSIMHPASSEDTSAEAWQMVRKAIARGNYHSEEDFEQFPEAVKRAVGSASQLRIWASDTEFNEGVESSNFKRVYQTVVNRQREEERLPIALKEQIRQIGELNNHESIQAISMEGNTLGI